MTYLLIFNNSSQILGILANESMIWKKIEEKGLEKLDVQICVYRVTNLSTMAAAAQATYRDAKKQSF
jgi:2-methylisocitrate lyase-like PEP mutase family enzyme